MNITCEVCRTEFTAQAGAQSRQHNGFVEFGIECPWCQKWTHAYYMTPTLEEEQRRLQAQQERHEAKRTEKSWQGYQFQLSAYKRAYAAVQRRYARKAGAKVTA